MENISANRHKIYYKFTCELCRSESEQYEYVISTEDESQPIRDTDAGFLPGEELREKVSKLKKKVKARVFPAEVFSHVKCATCNVVQCWSEEKQKEQENLEKGFGLGAVSCAAILGSIFAAFDSNPLWGFLLAILLFVLTSICQPDYKEKCKKSIKAGYLEIDWNGFFTNEDGSEDFDSASVKNYFVSLSKEIDYECSCRKCKEKLSGKCSVNYSHGGNLNMFASEEACNEFLQEEGRALLDAKAEETMDMMNRGILPKRIYCPKCKYWADNDNKPERANLGLMLFGIVIAITPLWWLFSYLKAFLSILE